jgi:hypothetical protein
VTDGPGRPLVGGDSRAALAGVRTPLRCGGGGVFSLFFFFLVHSGTDVKRFVTGAVMSQPWGDYRLERHSVIMKRPKERHTHTHTRSHGETARHPATDVRETQSPAQPQPKSNKWRKTYWFLTSSPCLSSLLSARKKPSRVSPRLFSRCFLSYGTHKETQRREREKGEN